jgi:TetR/AcrR family transcriptional repressor of nem operon
VTSYLDALTNGAIINRRLVCFWEEGQVPRTVNEQEHASKRNEILDAARRLIYTKGYEQMTIRDLLDELQISKGAFYHYYDSKQALLEGLIEQMQEEGERMFRGIAEDASLPTLAKLQAFFDASGRWKTARKDYLLALVRGWYADENALVRQKIEASMLRHVMPYMTRVIATGHTEGVLATPFPEQASAMVFDLLLGLGERFARVILAPERDPDALPKMIRLVEAYNDALERVVGAPAGSLHLMDVPTIQTWLAPSDEQPGQEPRVALRDPVEV